MGILFDDGVAGKLIKCEEEKKAMELKVEKLKMKKKSYKTEMLGMQAELENFKSTHVAKSEIEIVVVRVLLVVAIMVAVIKLCI